MATPRHASQHPPDHATRLPPPHMQLATSPPPITWHGTAAWPPPAQQPVAPAWGPATPWPGICRIPSTQARPTPPPGLIPPVIVARHHIPPQRSELGCSGRCGTFYVPSTPSPSVTSMACDSPPKESPPEELCDATATSTSFATSAPSKRGLHGGPGPSTHGGGPSMRPSSCTGTTAVVHIDHRPRTAGQISNHQGAPCPYPESWHNHQTQVQKQLHSPAKKTQLHTIRVNMTLQTKFLRFMQSYKYTSFSKHLQWSSRTRLKRSVEMPGQCPNEEKNATQLTFL